MLARGLLTVEVGWALMAIQALFAFIAKRLTPYQMIADGVPQGITFTSHGSSFWVIGALVPLMATLVALYSDQWSWQYWKYALAIAFVISVGMHVSYTLVPYPDFMMARKWVPSLAAMPHFVLFTGAIAILILTYTATNALNPAIAILTAWYITWHVFVGNHMLVKMDPPPHFPPYPFWDAGPIATICLVGIVMTGATIYALR